MSTYSEASIRVLKGLEPVKQRPGMYTRTDHPLHIVQEVIDNAADEALGGFATSIDVTLHADGTISVQDDGRGIPVGLHPDEGVPVVELVFTRLHAGGKFDKTSGGAYAFSGGLHGVGVSVTNALSLRLEVTVWRDKQHHRLVFADGEVIEPITSQPRISSGQHAMPKQGTRVTIQPDPKYFDSPHIPLAELRQTLRSKAVLLPNLRVTLHHANGQQEQWCYAQGLLSYLTEGLLGQSLLVPIFVGQGAIQEEHDTFAHGEGAEWVMTWSEEGSLVRESYVNLIPTPAGGTHEAGLRDAVYQALKSFIELHQLLPRGVKLLAEDVFSRTSFVLSTKMLDPQFQGQTKERLNSRDALRLVSLMVRSPFELWLNQHVDDAKKLADFVIRQAQSRQKSATKVEKKKSSGVAVLPGKLTDCESTDLTMNELFLVEGDSAGGSAKMGRDKRSQAILPLRGKVQNAWEIEADRLFANQEIHDVSVAIGVDPHTLETPNVNLTGLRYGKICILSDADVDGSHIQVLLLTLFYKHFPQLVAQGNIFVACPPLFRVDVAAQGKRPLRKLYCLDEGELQRTLDKLRKEGLKEQHWSISRFKGLGEMNPAQLWETTLNPDTRRLLPVCLGDFDNHSTTRMMQMLMGKTEAAARRRWLESRSDQATLDI